SIEGGAALGFIGAVGACGGYFIPRGFGASIAATGSPQLALMIYLAFYASCLALTWWFYLRQSFGSASTTRLPGARVWDTPENGVRLGANGCVRAGASSNGA